MNEPQSNTQVSSLEEKYPQNFDSERNREEQLKKNQSGLKWLTEKLDQESLLSQEELQQATDELEQLKQIIDENRERQFFKISQ